MRTLARLNRALIVASIVEACVHSSRSIERRRAAWRASALFARNNRNYLGTVVISYESC